MFKLKTISFILSAILIIGLVPATAFAEEKSINSAVITLGDPLTFNGEEQTQTVKSVVVNGETLVEGRDYIVSDNTGQYGRHTLNITGTGEYTGNKSYPFNILRKPLTIVNIVAEDRAYKSNNRVSVTYDINGLVSGFPFEKDIDYDLYAGMNDSSVGVNKHVDVVISATGNSKYYVMAESNYTTTVNIYKAAKDPVYITESVKSGDEASIELKKYIISNSDCSVEYEDEYGVLKNNPVVNNRLLEYAISDSEDAQGHEAVIKITVDNKNYNPYIVTVTLKIPSQKITADNIVCTYGDAPVIVAAGNVSPRQYTVSEGNDIISVDSEGKITTLKAGNAKVTLKAAKTGEYPEAVKEIDVQVNKKKISVAAKDRSIFTGEAVRDLSEPVIDIDYTAAGIAATDSVSIGLIYSKDNNMCNPLSNVAGEYEIVPVVTADTDKYDVDVINGKLIIQKKPGKGRIAPLPDTDNDGAISDIEDIYTIVKKLKVTTRTRMTKSKNIAVTCYADISEIENMGYTVKYNFYRSLEKNRDYEKKFTKDETTYYNTIGDKKTRYFYRCVISVYGKEGDVICSTELNQSRYGCRIWIK